ARERQALLRELRLVPVAVAHENLTWRRGLSGLCHDREQLGQGAGLREIHPRATADAMEVAVRETGNHRATSEIHDARAAALVAHPLAVRTHGEEAAILDRECLDDLASALAPVSAVAVVMVAVPAMRPFVPMMGGIARDHLAIEEDLVGGDPRPRRCAPVRG